jgi:hypothetical protein
MVYFFQRQLAQVLIRTHDISVVDFRNSGDCFNVVFHISVKTGTFLDLDFRSLLARIALFTRCPKLFNTSSLRYISMTMTSFYNSMVNKSLQTFA